MPALTHGRVKNGFNGYATRVGLSNTQPIKYNGGQKPKRNFKAEYNAQINAPNALPNTIGVSTAIKRANALRSANGGTKPGCDCLPHQTFSKPRQASKARQVQRVPPPPPLPIIYTITVDEWSGAAPGYMGIDLTAPPPFGSVSPPDPTNLFVLVLGTVTDVGIFVAVNIPGWPPAPFASTHNIKITNVTNNESQNFAIDVNTAGVGINIAATWPPALTLWAVNDIVTVEILD